MGKGEVRDTMMRRFVTVLASISLIALSATVGNAGVLSLPTPPTTGTTVLTDTTGVLSWSAGGGGGITALTQDLSCAGSGSVACPVVQLTGAAGNVPVVTGTNLTFRDAAGHDSTAGRLNFAGDVSATWAAFRNAGNSADCPVLRTFGGNETAVGNDSCGNSTIFGAPQVTIATTTINAFVANASTVTVGTSAATISLNATTIYDYVTGAGDGRQNASFTMTNQTGVNVVSSPSVTKFPVIVLTAFTCLAGCQLNFPNIAGGWTVDISSLTLTAAVTIKAGTGTCGTISALTVNDDDIEVLSYGGNTCSLNL